MADSLVCFGEVDMYGCVLGFVEEISGVYSRG